MARLAVLLDRTPNDPEWKGAFAWDILLALSESQHEVLALTTCDPAEIEISHPRLTIARPGPSFHLAHFPKWLRAILQFQPEIVHTFALKTPGAFSIWPLLEPALKALPQIRRYSTSFEDGDFVPFDRVRPPLEFGPVQASASPAGEYEARGDLVIPAPVHQWHRPQMALVMLADFLMNSPALSAHIIGGWGSLSLSMRREGWSILEGVASRVHMTEAMNWRNFVQRLSQSHGLWLRPLAPGSWAALASAHAAGPFGIPVWGESPTLISGSSANFLSRLYSQS